MIARLVSKMACNVRRTPSLAASRHGLDILHDILVQYHAIHRTTQSLQFRSSAPISWSTLIPRGDTDLEPVSIERVILLSFVWCQVDTSGLWRLICRCVEVLL